MADEGERELLNANPVNDSPSHAPPLSPIALLDPLQELCPSLDAVQALCARAEDSLPGGESFRGRCLVKAFLKAATSGDAELLGWMCYMHSQQDRDDVKESGAFRTIDLKDCRDDECTGPLVLAASSGHVEAVRLLVRYGFQVDERDALGWTPLMWAINNVNLPLVSFLLSQGANSHVSSYKGTTCEDFIVSSDPLFEEKEEYSRGNQADDDTRMVSQDRQLIGELIYEHQKAQGTQERAEEDDIAAQFQQMSVTGSRSAASQSASGFIKHTRQPSSSARRLIGRTERTQLLESDLRTRELAEGRRRVLLDMAVMLQVEYEDLVGEPPAEERSEAQRGSGARKKRKKHKVSRSGLASGCGAIEVGSDPLSNDFDFGHVHADQMLVFGELQIEAIINFLVHRARPIRAPWTDRSRPANVIYLCLRFAARSQDLSLQEELVFAYISAVEAVLYAKPNELTHLSFWLHNSVLLLHYLKVDAAIAGSDAAEEQAALLSELINEIFIFIVRDVERRIDKILQVAVLDHESIPMFEEVRYEDEWSFLKTIRGSVKGLGGAGAGTQAYNSPSSSLRRPLSQIFSKESGSTRNSHADAARATVSATPLSSVFPSSPPSTIASPSKQRQESNSNSAAELLAKPSPRTITALLTSVLHVLQLYEVNPCVIVQAFSQVLFWVGCEVFNRMVSHKRYLCKNKAMQIRLNISALEDWAKTNAMPSSLVQVHFDKTNQLISWVLCQSSLHDFDALIATVQGLRSITPAQLKYVVGEYRYEVGEGRMGNDCVQYLQQLHADWARVDAADPQNATTYSHGHSRSGTATQENKYGRIDEEEDAPSEDQDGSRVGTPDQVEDGVQARNEASASVERAMAEAQSNIDLLFVSGRSLNDFQAKVPETSSVGVAGAANAAGSTASPLDAVLLNSRDMLPFVLPSSAAALVVSPGDAFGFGRGHFMGTGTPSLRGMRTPSLLPTPSGRSPLPLDAAHRARMAAATTTNEQRTANSSSSSISSVSLSSSPLKTRGKVAPPSPSILQDSLLAAPAPRRPHGLAIADVATSAVETDGERDADAISQRSSNATIDSVASSSVSTLFPQGKGLAAGSSWQPVPLLPDGTLEALGEVLRI